MMYNFREEDLKKNFINLLEIFTDPSDEQRSLGALSQAIWVRIVIKGK